MGDQDIGNLGRPVLSGLQVPSERGHCHARKRPQRDLSVAFFLFLNVLQLHQYYSYLLVHYLRKVSCRILDQEN